MIWHRISIVWASREERNQGVFMGPALKSFALLTILSTQAWAVGRLQVIRCQETDESPLHREARLLIPDRDEKPMKGHLTVLGDNGEILGRKNMRSKGTLLRDGVVEYVSQSGA
jgi:hypothetical protein